MVLLPFVTRRFDERKGYSFSSFFSPPISTLPFRVSFPLLYSLLSRFFSPYFFFSLFFYSPREYFHHSGGVQCWGCTQWELNSTSFSRFSPSLSLFFRIFEDLSRRDSRRYRAHNGEGICNNEATMNRSAPRCLSTDCVFVGTLFIYISLSRTPLTPAGWRPHVFPNRWTVTKIYNLVAWTASGLLLTRGWK